MAKSCRPGALPSLVGGALLVLPSARVAHAQSPSQTLPVQPWPMSLGLVLAYAVLLFGLMMVIHLYDARKAYSQTTTLTAREGKAAADGIPGTTRSIFAYALLLVLGIAVFHLLVVVEDLGATDKLLSTLSGTVAAIIGSYFGSKATQEAKEPAREAVAPFGRIVFIQPIDITP